MPDGSFDAIRAYQMGGGGGAGGGRGGRGGGGGRQPRYQYRPWEKFEYSPQFAGQRRLYGLLTAPQPTEQQRQSVIRGVQEGLAPIFQQAGGQQQLAGGGSGQEQFGMEPLRGAAGRQMTEALLAFELGEQQRAIQARAAGEGYRADVIGREIIAPRERRRGFRRQERLDEAQIALMMAQARGMRPAGFGDQFSGALAGTLGERVGGIGQGDLSLFGFVT